MVATTSEVNLLVIDIEIYYLFRICNKYLCMQKVSITCLLYDVWYMYLYTCSYRTYNKKYSFWKMITDMHFYIEFAWYFIRNAYFEDSWVICKQNIHFTKIVINYT